MIDLIIRTVLGLIVFGGGLFIIMTILSLLAAAVSKNATKALRRVRGRGWYGRYL